MNPDSPLASVADTWELIREYEGSELETETAVDRLCQYLSAEDPAVAKTAFHRVLYVADSEEQYLAAGKSLADTLADGYPIGFGLATDLQRVCVNEPVGLDPVLPHLEDVLRDEEQRGGSVITASAVLGLLGSHAPGIVRRSVPALAEGIDVNREAEGLFGRSRGAFEVVEIASALARVGVNEPAVVRPFVAKQVWDLDADSTDAIAASLDNLGRIGLVLPWLVPPTDTLPELLSHPSEQVRTAAARATGRLYGVETVEGEAIGIPDTAPAAVHEALADAPRDRIEDSGSRHTRAFVDWSVESLLWAKNTGLPFDRARLPSRTTFDRPPSPLWN